MLAEHILKLSVTEKETLQPHAALILHTNQTSQYQETTTTQAITFHPIKGGEIQHGVAIDKNQLLDAIGQADTVNGLDFIEPTTLMCNGKGAIWYRPSMKRQMHFSSQALGNIQFNVTFPATLFILNKSNMSLFLFGLAKDERPTPETVLYRLPIGNVSERGHLCQGSGSAHMPSEVHQGTFHQAERVFFGAVSGHTSAAYLFKKDEKTKRRTHFDSVIRYWQKHAEKGTKPSVARDFVKLNSLSTIAKGVL